MDSTTTASHHHVLVVSNPAQGQINPLLRLAKHLASPGGLHVTFSTTAIAGQKIIDANGIVPGRLYPLGEGFLRFDFLETASSLLLELTGPNQLREMLRRFSDQGLPVTCLIKGNILPWVADIANELSIPLATLWAQSCTSFLSFYYYYNHLVPFPTEEHPYADVEIPTLPLLKWDELHGFLHPFCSTKFPFMREKWLREFDNLGKPFCILMDTFHDLEPHTVSLTTKLCPTIKCVGPLFRGPVNLEIDAAVDVSYSCLDWLDTQPQRSVVYICFGSTAHLKQDQVDELAHGILNSGAPFLWVVRTPDPGSEFKPYILPKNMGDGCNGGGLVVEYSPQEKVLDHPSVACFVTHCGWNSTVEALASGVPMVAFPLWGDQLTNAKFLVDMLGVAVRMRHGWQTGKVVPREEVEMCIREAAVGARAEEMRRKAVAWKDKAVQAYQQGGSSNTNLHAFVEEIRQRRTITAVAIKVEEQYTM